MEGRGEGAGGPRSARAEPLGEERGNLVGGRRAPTQAGRTPVHAATPPFEHLGTFPVSDAETLRAALAGLVSAPAAWGGLDPAERRRRLARAAQVFAEADLRPAARRLGLDPAELQAHRGPLEVPEPQGEAGAARGGVALCAPAWSELFCGTWHAVAGELATGRAVLLAADPRLPHVANALVLALLEAGIPGEALALAHGAGEAALEAACADPAVVRLRASGAAPRIARLRRAAAQAGCETSLSVPAAAGLELAPEADLAAAAADVVERAFGRVRSLFGQLAGQVARVFVPERRFAPFTALLLSALEESEPARRPLPLIDDETVLAARAAWARGLDEGATLIFGGRAPAGAAAGARLVLPTVFTNVELDMELPHRREPLPVLSLVRARDLRP